MRYRKQAACLGVMIVALAACDKAPQAGKSSGPTPDTIRAVERRLAGIAGQANQAAPAEVDPNTRLDGARAGPGMKLAITYTLVNAESEGVNGTTFEAKLSPAIKTGSCKNPDLRPLIDLGAVVVLDYRGNDGKPIATLSINRETCAAIK